MNDHLKAAKLTLLFLAKLLLAWVVGVGVALGIITIAGLIGGMTTFVIGVVALFLYFVYDYFLDTVRNNIRRKEDE